MCIYMYVCTIAWSIGSGSTHVLPVDLPMVHFSWPVGTVGSTDLNGYPTYHWETASLYDSMYF